MLGYSSAAILGHDARNLVIIVDVANISHPVFQQNVVHETVNNK